MKYVVFCLCVFAALQSSYSATVELTLVGEAGGKLFYTSPHNGTMTWMKAQEFCYVARPGMRLAALESDAEREVAVNYLDNNYNNPDHAGIMQFWVSATDFGSEGEFHWTKSGKLTPELTTLPGRARNCLKLQFGNLYFDEECSTYSSKFIWPLCEIDGASEATTTTPASTTTVKTTTTTTVAPFTCTSEGNHADPFQCDVFHVCIKFREDFIEYEMQCPEFTNYCEVEQVCGHPEQCPCSTSEPSDMVHSANLENDNSNLKHVLKSGSDELILVGNVGSKHFYTAKRGNTNWIDAMEFCHQNEMMLASMENEAERSLLLGYISTVYSLDYFWLAGVNYGSGGVYDYYWINNGTPVYMDAYGNGGKENCLYLSGTGPIYSWHCENNKYSTLWPLCQSIAGTS